MKPLKEWGISVVRTSVVPPIAGFIVAWLVKHNITDIKSEWVFSITAFVLSALWYLIFRGIEILSTKPKVMKIVGILLGYPRINVQSDPNLAPPVE